MSANEVTNKYVEAIINASSPEEVDAVFTQLETENADVRAAAVDAIEKNQSDAVLATSDQDRFQTRMLVEMLQETRGKTAMRAMHGFDAMEDEMRQDLDNMQGTARLFMKIAEIKGDAAHPVVKAYVAAASKLTDEQFNDPLEHLKLVMDASETVVTPPVKLRPNPLRKNTP